VCETNTRKLITDDRVFALTCYVGTPTVVKIIPLVEEAQIPLVAFLPVQPHWREPVHPYIVNIRASYREEVKVVIDHFIKDNGFSRVAVFTRTTTTGGTGSKGRGRHSASMDWSRLRSASTNAAQPMWKGVGPDRGK